MHSKHLIVGSSHAALAAATAIRFLDTEDNEVGAMKYEDGAI